MHDVQVHSPWAFFAVAAGSSLRQVSVWKHKREQVLRPWLICQWVCLGERVTSMHAGMDHIVYSTLIEIFDSFQETAMNSIIHHNAHEVTTGGLKNALGAAELSQR